MGSRGPLPHSLENPWIQPGSASQQALEASGFPHFCCLERDRIHLRKFISIVLRASSTWRCTGFSLAPHDPGQEGPLSHTAGRVNTAAELMQRRLPSDTGEAAAGLRRTGTHRREPRSPLGHRLATEPLAWSHRGVTTNKPLTSLGFGFLKRAMKGNISAGFGQDPGDFPRHPPKDLCGDKRSASVIKCPSYEHLLHQGRVSSCRTGWHHRHLLDSQEPQRHRCGRTQQVPPPPRHILGWGRSPSQWDHFQTVETCMHHPTGQLFSKRKLLGV